MSIIQTSNTTGIINKTFLLTTGLAVFAGILIVFGLTFWKASSNFYLGEKYLLGKEYPLAILAFEQTILNPFPGSPYQKRAIKHLFEIGDQAYLQKNIPVALQAYHTILFATASLSVYRDLSSEESQSVIDRLKKINTVWIGPKIPKHFPNRLWSLGMGIFFLGWIFSIFILIQTGFDKTGKILKPAFYYPFLLFIITFSLWLTSLLNL
ncbi:MAG: hypothetical protein HY787_09840 [Deltaproteobacteria bacterium]|nr:hypothetical protein [Deltaproteobacteria bacterium]